MTRSGVLLALDALAVFRLTHLIVDDTITHPLRARLAERRLLGELVTCPWCVSPYLAAIVVVLQTLAPRPCLYAAAVLAFSAVAGILSELL